VGPTSASICRARLTAGEARSAAETVTLSRSTACVPLGGRSTRSTPNMLNDAVARTVGEFGALDILVATHGVVGLSPRLK